MVSRVLAGTDLFLPSSEDLSALFPGASEADAVARAFEAGAGRIAMKKGSAGCAYFMPGRVLLAPRARRRRRRCDRRRRLFLCNLRRPDRAGQRATRGPGPGQCRRGVIGHRSRSDGRQQCPRGRQEISGNDSVSGHPRTEVRIMKSFTFLPADADCISETARAMPRATIVKAVADRVLFVVDPGLKTPFRKWCRTCANR